jgi:hypothetical protein
LQLIPEFGGLLHHQPPSRSSRRLGRQCRP